MHCYRDHTSTLAIEVTDGVRSCYVGCTYEKVPFFSLSHHIFFRIPSMHTHTTELYSQELMQIMIKPVQSRCSARDSISRATFFFIWIFKFLQWLFSALPSPCSSSPNTSVFSGLSLHSSLPNKLVLSQQKHFYSGFIQKKKIYLILGWKLRIHLKFNIYLKALLNELILLNWTLVLE